MFKVIQPINGRERKTNKPGIVLVSTTDTDDELCGKWIIETFPL